jgi:hypothetical protein
MNTFDTTTAVPLSNVSAPQPAVTLTSSPASSCFIGIAGIVRTIIMSTRSRSLAPAAGTQTYAWERSAGAVSEQSADPAENAHAGSMGGPPGVGWVHTALIDRHDRASRMHLPFPIRTSWRSVARTPIVLLKTMPPPPLRNVDDCIHTASKDTTRTRSKTQ